MGLFDFVTDAGKKLMGSDDEPAAEPQSQTKDYSPEEIKRINQRRRAMGLVKEVEGLGLEVTDLGIRVDGDVATISGEVASPEIQEKVVLAVGNVAGIARVDDNLSVAEAGMGGETYVEGTRYHTVVSGDTLSGIAKEYYGNAMKYPVIFEANKPMLEDPDKIYPGQVLRIPAVA